MATSEKPIPLEVTPAAREAIGAAIARHSHPVIVRLRIVPGDPPAAQMYLAKPWPGEPVLEYGPARLAVDRGSEPYLRGAVVDFHPAPPGAAQGSFSVDGPGLRRVPATDTPPTTDPNSPAGSPTGASVPASGPEAVLRDSLRRIYDPEIPINIVDLGLIYGIDWPEEGRVRIRMTMTSPGCPVAGMLQDEVKAAAERVEGIRAAEVRIVWDPPWHPDRMSTEAKRQFGYA